MYWCCAQVEPRRERLASHCLTLAGYEIYQPLLREQRRSHGRPSSLTDSTGRAPEPSRTLTRSAP